jgi:hypothetical protein
VFNQLLLNGIIAGSIYALIALGFSIIYKTVRFFHELFPLPKDKRNQKAGVLSTGKQQLLAIGYFWGVKRFLSNLILISRKKGQRRTVLGLSFF